MLCLYGLGCYGSGCYTCGLIKIDILYRLLTDENGCNYSDYRECSVDCEVGGTGHIKRSNSTLNECAEYIEDNVCQTCDTDVAVLVPQKSE